MAAKLPDYTVSNDSRLDCSFRKKLSAKSSSRGLEIKSSSRRYGPTAFVKDADFSYIDLDRTDSRKKKNREMERYRSLERYHAVKVDNLTITNTHTQTGASLDSDRDDDGGGGGGESVQAATPVFLNNRLFDVKHKTTNIDSPQTAPANTSVVVVRQGHGYGQGHIEGQGHNYGQGRNVGNREISTSSGSLPEGSGRTVVYVIGDDDFTGPPLVVDLTSSSPELTASPAAALPNDSPPTSFTTSPHPDEASPRSSPSPSSASERYNNSLSGDSSIHDTNPTSANDPPGYIGEFVSADFEDPRVFISYL